jgi:MFS family permease
MFSKMRKIIISSLVGGIGIGIAGVLFAYLQTMEEENTWLWILGWLLIGLIVNVTLGFIIGSKKITTFAMWGVVAGVVGGFLSGNPDYELWMKIGIIGLAIGVGMGAAGASYTPPVEKKIEPKKKEDERTITCDECGALVAEDDCYCHECGTEFEE